ncbi:MAG: hypothetical protein JST01_10650 [Cyanobacteria bacterium SZAS TMP-1]|nr:hypothetical protein [Cyanobacteria bacterium SZAS TMP-1]
MIFIELIFDRAQQPWRKYLRRQVRKFDRLHGSEADVNEQVCTGFLDPRAVRCHHCGGAKIVRDWGERVGQCLSCGKKVHYTAGTFFHKKRNLRCWLLCAWLFEQGIVFNPSQFHQVAGIAYSTAWTIFKKISLAVQYFLDGQEGAIDVDSAHFIQLFSRRSLLTPAGAHPSVEQENIEESSVHPGTAGGAASSPVAVGILTVPCSLSPMEKLVLNLISDAATPFDVLQLQSGLQTSELAMALLNLELEDLIQRESSGAYILTVPRAARSGRRRVQQAKPAQFSGNPSAPLRGAQLQEKLAECVESLRLNHQGFSRKYLQIHIASYWCQFVRSCTSGDSSASSFSVKEACMQAPEITDDDIRNYVTPFKVKLMAA